MQAILVPWRDGQQWDQHSPLHPVLHASARGSGASSSCFLSCTLFLSHLPFPNTEQTPEIVLMGHFQGWKALKNLSNEPLSCDQKENRGTEKSRGMLLTCCMTLAVSIISKVTPALTFHGSASKEGTYVKLSISSSGPHGMALTLNPQQGSDSPLLHLSCSNSWVPCIPCKFSPTSYFQTNLPSYNHYNHQKSPWLGSSCSNIVPVSGNCVSVLFLRPRMHFTPQSWSSAWHRPTP